MTKWPVRIFTAGIVAVILLATYFIRTAHENDRRIEAARVERIQQINAVNQAQCASLRNLYAVIRKSLEDSDAQIDKLAYYREHPGEARDAHRRNQDTIRRFKTPVCPPRVTVEE